jgi:hypothetical protein
MFKYITVNPNPREQWRGVGHQFMNFLVPYILSKKYNLRFVYQPFAGESDGTFAPKKSNAFQVDQPVKLWNRFLNFDENELTLNDIKNIKIIGIPNINPEECRWNHPKFKELFEKEYEEDILFVVPDTRDGMFIHIDWSVFNSNDLRNKYHLAKSKQPQPINYLNKCILNIALHRRAGDVSKENPFNRWIPLDYYLKIIDNINNIKFDKQHIIHIYSYDINKEEIIQLENKSNILLHINENTFDTFHNMVNCDILINGQSSFSIMASYLSRGIKLCTPWFIHFNNFPKDIKDIIEVRENGSFNENKLMEAMV